MRKTIKALVLYFKSSKFRYWYRDSTNEWVLEVNITIPKELDSTIRYPAKNKLLCFLKWLKGIRYWCEDLHQYV